jgi:very-short-patch-repair endonuclease
MHIGSSLLAVVLLFAVAAIAIALIGKRPAAGARFKARPFLTPNELEFLARLEKAAPELRFHAQVAMGALLAPAVAKGTDSRAHMSARGSFSQKIVDFVAQSRDTGAVSAVIELDDRTHDSVKDEKRDAMLVEAGYSVVRWHSRTKPDTEEIRRRLVPARSLEVASTSPQTRRR